jgi:hypothetical protein
LWIVVATDLPGSSSDTLLEITEALEHLDEVEDMIPYLPEPEKKKPCVQVWGLLRCQQNDRIFAHA